jgi:hypothetical protein
MLTRAIDCATNSSENLLPDREVSESVFLFCFFFPVARLLSFLPGRA